eukprot:9691142-Prorocentrum_lima.AAC.1
MVWRVGCYRQLSIFKGRNPHGRSVRVKRRTWLWRSSGTPQSTGVCAAQARTSSLVSSEVSGTV